MGFFTKNKRKKGTTSPAASVFSSPSVVSLSSTSTESESAFEMVANSSTRKVSPSPNASTSYGSESWQMACPSRNLSGSTRSLFRHSSSPLPTEEQLLDEYAQVSVELWLGAEDYEVEVEVEAEVEEFEDVKGYASASAIPNSPTDASIMFDFRTDDLGHADETVENTRGLQEPTLPREHIALNAGTRFGYYAACDEGKICMVDLSNLSDDEEEEEEEEEEDVNVLFDSEDSSTFVDWPTAPVVTLCPIGIAAQFARLAAQNVEVEELSKDIVPYSDDEGEEVQVQVTRMRMFDHDTKREYYIEFDVQGNMTFCFDLEAEVETNELDDEVSELRPGIDFLPGLEHITKPFVRCVFVDNSCADEAQAPVDTGDDQDIVHIVDAYFDPDMVADISEDGEFIDITHIIHSELKTSSASSSSEEVVPKLVSGIGMSENGERTDITHFLHVEHETNFISSPGDVGWKLIPGIEFSPTFKHFANPIIRSVFVDYQRAGPVESAIETEDDDDQDFLDSDSLSNMGEDGEFTDITRPVTYYYSADTQHEVAYYAMNNLLEYNLKYELDNITEDVFDSPSSDESESSIKFEGLLGLVEPLEVHKADFVSNDEEKSMHQRKSNLIKFLKPTLQRKAKFLVSADDDPSLSSKPSIKFEGKCEFAKLLEVRKADFIYPFEEDWKTHDRKSALKNLQGESGVKDWFFDNKIWQCDSDTQFDVIENAFSDWSSDEDEDEEEDYLCSRSSRR